MKNIPKYITDFAKSLNLKVSQITFSHKNVKFKGYSFKDENQREIITIEGRGTFDDYNYSLKTKGKVSYDKSIRNLINKHKKQIGMGTPKTTSTTKKKAKKRTSATSLCRKVIKVPGLNAKGQLLKGWHYVNGKPVKSKPAAKKKPAAKTKLNAPKKSANVFTTKLQAQKFAREKNKTSRTFRYVVALYPKSKGGNGKAHIVRKVRKE